MSTPKRPDLPGDLFDLPIDPPASPVEPAEDETEREHAGAAPEGAEQPLADPNLAPESSGTSLPLFDRGITSEVEPEPALDLDLGPAPAAQSREVTPASSGPPSGIFDQLPDPEHNLQEELELEDDALPQEDAEAILEPAGFLVRLQSGAADLLAHLAVLSSALVAMKLLGLQPALDQWPGFVSFLALFSFLYLAFPLAFWGHTPGMAWFGLVARDQGDRPLAFGQTGVRVAASWLTVGGFGVPLLLALGGRSLADRLSRSETWIAERPN